MSSPPTRGASIQAAMARIIFSPAENSSHYLATLNLRWVTPGELITLRRAARALRAERYGEHSLTAARTAGPEGGVVATDISAEMIAFGRERAIAAGLENIEFVESDAVPHLQRQGDEARHLLGTRARARRPRPRSGGRLPALVVLFAKWVCGSYPAASAVRDG